MLRINVLEDPDFRKELFTVIRGMLRDFGREVIKDEISKDGWLEKQFSAAFSHQYITKLMQHTLSSMWVNQDLRTFLQSKILEFLIEPRFLEQTIRPLITDLTKKALKEEIAKRLGS